MYITDIKVNDGRKSAGFFICSIEIVLLAGIVFPILPILKSIMPLSWSFYI